LIICANAIFSFHGQFFYWKRQVYVNGYHLAIGIVWSRLPAPENEATFPLTIAL